MKTTLAVMIALGGFTITAAAADAPQQVTFSKDVAPIFQEHCQNCHHVGTVAPMSLVTYEEARPWARAIKQRVSAREMPPWFIDRNIGVQHFNNDESLTDDEIATIVKWVDSGAPQGSPADMPAARKFADDQAWQIGKPDMIITLPKDVVVKAHGADWWPDILVDPGLTEDRYVQGIQIVPTKGYNVVHHIRTSIVEPDAGTRHSGQLDGNVQLEVGEQGVFLNEYAIGKGADVFPDGSGRLIKAGTKINFQFHLHSSGTETPTNVALGLKLYPKGYTPKHVITSLTVGINDVDLRPHEANVRSDAYMPLIKPARLLSFQPHMHNRGKAECLEAIYPNGKTEMLSCARFEFNWMRNYVYADDAAPLLPAGTILHSIMWHDNSDQSRFNPDPDAQVTWGERTVDEMASAWLSYYYMSEEDYKKEMEARKAAHPKLISTR
jgi:mono/diheme cytochrome c family protein